MTIFGKIRKLLGLNEKAESRGRLTSQERLEYAKRVFFEEMERMKETRDEDRNKAKSNRKQK